MNEEVYNLNYDSVAEIKTLLEMMGLGPRKRWGQNFLINSGARAKIVNRLELQKDDIVWEIGPGLGALTTLVAQEDVDLRAFEIDPGYVEYLSRAMAKYSRFRIIPGDVVKTWPKELKEGGVPDKIMGNLPYNAASAILGDFIENGFFPKHMVLTVQSEMGDRIVAKVGTKPYSSFSILCQSVFDVKDCGTLNPGSFYPAPRVASRIISLKPHNKFTLADPKIFHHLIRDVFVSRRKTLRNNLTQMAKHRFSHFGKETLFKVFEGRGIDLSTRPEKLDVKTYIDLANALSQVKKQK